MKEKKKAYIRTDRAFRQKQGDRSGIPLSFLQPVAGVLVVFAAWYLVCRMELLSAYVLPSP